MTNRLFCDILFRHPSRGNQRRKKNVEKKFWKTKKLLDRNLILWYTKRVRSREMSAANTVWNNRKLEPFGFGWNEKSQKLRKKCLTKQTECAIINKLRARAQRESQTQVSDEWYKQLHLVNWTTKHHGCKKNYNTSQHLWAWRKSRNKKSWFYGIRCLSQ